MRNSRFKRWFLAPVALLTLTGSASATVWYSSFNPWTQAVITTSRVDGSGFPMMRQVFNTFNLSGFRNLSFVQFYAPNMAPMYQVELRYGGPNSTSVFYRVFGAPVMVLPDPIFGLKITIAVPSYMLVPGTWSVSLSTDGRFSTIPGFYSPNFCPGWTLTFNPQLGKIFFSDTSGLMIQLADSL